ncbi:MAG: DNA-binding protein [Alphaproteobacteria bacterium HGW-Alphaproteobacteria-1]|jgi:DNA-binding protein HU-alpha|nr:MAG: DNA-binding protein [Alphaproteobacteria bacterium HGW-Alphaproteobacteria-1]
MATKPSSRSTTRKPAADRSGAAKPKLVVADTSEAETPSLPELKRQELLAQVVKRADIKKKLAKPVLDAALAVIGEALAEGRDLNLAPLGKLKINRVRELGNGRVIIARIRQGAAGRAGPDAEDDEDMKEVVAEPLE